MVELKDQKRSLNLYLPFFYNTVDSARAEFDIFHCILVLLEKSGDIKIVLYIETKLECTVEYRSSANVQECCNKSIN